jgi:hypothetical protein
VRHACQAAAAHGVTRRLGSRQRKQFLQRIGGNRRRSRQQLRRGCNHRNRFEIAERIIFCILEDQRIHQMRIVVPHDRIAVRLRAGDDLRADYACSTGPVIDDERLPECDGQLLRNRSRGEIGAATRRVRNDDAHGAHGIFLGPKYKRGMGARYRHYTNDRNISQLFSRREYAQHQGAGGENEAPRL